METAPAFRLRRIRTALATTSSTTDSRQARKLQGRIASSRGRRSAHPSGRQQPDRHRLRTLARRAARDDANQGPDLRQARTWLPTDMSVRGRDQRHLSTMLSDLAAEAARGICAVADLVISLRRRRPQPAPVGSVIATTCRQGLGRLPAAPAVGGAASMMGKYLSHRGNQKADPAAGRVPAGTSRVELMQIVHDRVSISKR